VREGLKPPFDLEDQFLLFSGEYYFIRIISNGLMDTAQPMYPYQSYSARFT
jgi:hypothetical protein